MKKYIHNPDIYRRHYKAQVGRALPGFSGSRMQHGEGIGAFLGSLARKAMPIISSGLKMAKPHLTKAAKGVAKDLTAQVSDMAIKKLTARSPKAGAVAKNIIRNSNLGTAKRKVKTKRKRKPFSKRRKVKASRPRDIF